MEAGIPEPIELSYPFRRGMAFVGIFFIITPLMLIASLLALISLESSGPAPVLAAEEIIEYQTLGHEESTPSVSMEIGSSDARVEVVRNYLKRYNSPLVSQADYLVEMADKYELDFRLVTAISQQESNLCKKIPPNTYNCWGWGIHSAGTLGFESYEHGIETVSAGLRREYLNKGFETVEEIMSKYTPLSNGSWAAGVTAFMAEMI